MPPRKKITQPEDAQAQESSSSTGIKPKREKKSKKHNVVAVVTPDGIQGNFQSDVRKPLIVTLPIHSNDIDFHDQPFTYDPKPPVAYDAFNADISDPFSAEAAYDNAPVATPIANMTLSNLEPTTSSQKTVQEHKQQNQPQGQPQTITRREYGPTTLLVQYANTKITKELPSETNLSCFWCCEHFSGKPCVIPISITENVWNVYGNFCTPQCSMAYLLSELMDTHTRWERIALLNRLYGSQMNTKIYPAPSRESLERFGGPIRIEDFRAICESQRIRVDIHLPPMVSILASMDTKPIDFYESPLHNTFTSTNHPPITRNNDESSTLKLRRSKPLKDKESTLDACLNITIRSEISAR
jgi:hypothetical protein